NGPEGGATMSEYPFCRCSKSRAALRALTTLCALLALTTSASAGDWPQFRGPGGAGVSDETGIPITWSEKENIRWKADLPARGSPVSRSRVDRPARARPARSVLPCPHGQEAVGAATVVHREHGLPSEDVHGRPDACNGRRARLRPVRHRRPRLCRQRRRPALV